MSIAGYLLILASLVGFLWFSLKNPGYGYSMRERDLTLFQYLWLHNWYSIVGGVFGIVLIIIGSIL